MKLFKLMGCEIKYVSGGKLKFKKIVEVEACAPRWLLAWGTNKQKASSVV